MLEKDQRMRCGSELPRRLAPGWTYMIIVVIVSLAAAPWLNGQMLTVLCALLGGTLPVLLARQAPALQG